MLAFNLIIIRKVFNNGDDRYVEKGCKWAIEFKVGRYQSL